MKLSQKPTAAKFRNPALSWHCSHHRTMTFGQCQQSSMLSTNDSCFSGPVCWYRRQDSGRDLCMDYRLWTLRYRLMQWLISTTAYGRAWQSCLIWESGSVWEKEQKLCCCLLILEELHKINLFKQLEITSLIQDCTWLYLKVIFRHFSVYIIHVQVHESWKFFIFFCSMAIVLLVWGC